MKMKKKTLVIGIISLIYTVLGSSYIFFPDGRLNEVLSVKSGLAHFYAFSALTAFLMLVFSIVMLFISRFRNRFKLKFDGADVILIFTVVLSLFFIFFGAEHKKIEAEDSAQSSIKLCEWNAADNINEKNIQAVFGEFDADIAVFPELGGYKKGDKPEQRLADLFKKAELDFAEYRVYVSEETEGNIAPVTVVLKKTLGPYDIYEERPATRFGTLYLSSRATDSPPLIGLHTAPPLPGLMRIWQRDLDLITELAGKHQDAIIIGDFNATMKHGRLHSIRTHTDVLDYAPRFHSGTWNTNIPSVFRTRIDHILIPNNKYSVTSAEIKKFPNSDHLCVFAELQSLGD